MIRAENIGKMYKIYPTAKNSQAAFTYLSFREMISDTVKKTFSRKKYHNDEQPQEFWALKNISFEIKNNQKVGIIGRNGAGKSTLLKVISRITGLSTGRLIVAGRVASLLEVGTGFHPELTGRENIYLNGAILGMTKADIRKRFDEIVAFSETEKFLDTPVKRYSSGMYVRLAFSVAAHLEPETLIIDEILAVGDTQFQKKCLGRMEKIGSEGRTLIFVSHNMSMISALCDRVICLHKGQLVNDGAPSDVILNYYSNTNQSPAYCDYTHGPPAGDKDVQIIEGKICDEEGNIRHEFVLSEPIKICMTYKIINKIGAKVVPNFHFYTADGSCLFVDNAPGIKPMEPGVYTAECVVPRALLNEGAYSVGLAATSYFSSYYTVNFYEKNILSFNVKDNIFDNEKRYGYGGAIPGVIRPSLEWRIRPAKEITSSAE